MTGMTGSWLLHPHSDFLSLFTSIFQDLQSMEVKERRERYSSGCTFYMPDECSLQEVS